MGPKNRATNWPCNRFGTISDDTITGMHCTVKAKYWITSIQDLTCAIADLGLCVKHDPDTDAVDFPPEMGAVDDGGSVKVR